MLLHCLFTCIVSDRKSAVIFVSLNVMPPAWLLSRFSLSLVLSNFTVMCLGVIFFMFFCGRVCEASWTCWFQFSSSLGDRYIFRYFFLPLGPLRHSSYMNIRPLEVVPQLTDAFFTFKNSFCVLFWLVSVIVSSSSLIFSSVISDQLMISSSVVFISAVVFISQV